MADGEAKRKLPPMEKLLKILTKKRFLEGDDAFMLRNMSVSSSELSHEPIEEDEVIEEEVEEIEVDESEINDEDMFSQDAKSFALSLYYYSPEGYGYICNRYNTCLPAVGTLRTWYKHKNGVPGFTEESFKYIEDRAKKASKKIYCSLILKEFEDYFATKEQYVSGEGYFGFENVGSEIDSDCQNWASTLLLFTASAINDSWSLPIGYVLLKNYSSAKITGLVKTAIYLLEKSGVHVISLGLNTTNTYKNAAESLGCSLTTENRRVMTTFQTEESKDICVFPHLNDVTNYLRDVWEGIKEFKDGNGKAVSWKYIAELIKTAKDASSKAKIKKNPLSRDVAGMLKRSKEELKLPAFKDADATVQFLNYCNDLFDILTSTDDGSGLKKAINDSNKGEVVEKLDAIIGYFSGIRASPHLNFMWYCVVAESVKELIKLYLNENYLDSIPLYKVTEQTAAELFEDIKRHAGTPNVTAYKFKNAFQKLLKSKLVTN